MDLRRISIYKIYLIVVIWLSLKVDAGRIVVFVLPTWSHIKPKINVATQLARLYGHQTTFVLNKIYSKKIQSDNYTNVIVPYKYGNFDLTAYTNVIINDTCKGKTTLSQFVHIRNIAWAFCELLLSDNELHELLKKQQFDVALVDNVMVGDCLNLMAYRLGIPYIQMGVMYNSVRNRVPFMPSVHPVINLIGFTEEMTFMQRVVNTMLTIAIAISPNLLLPSDAISTYAPEKPFLSLEVLHRRAAFHLIDADFVLDLPRPIMPNVAYIGGVGIEEAKPDGLPEDLKEFMNNASHGVIVCSFGSVVATLPVDRIQKLFRVFKTFENIKFVIKYGNETKTDDNFLLMPWLPQTDLLAHPNTKAFITHCGSTGVYEALYHGVPMIGLPFMTDGFHNCRNMAHRGYGISYDFCKFTESDIVNALRSILQTSKYSQKIKKASEIFHDQPGTPSERAAYWIDHVIQHGGDYLQTAATDMPFYKYYLLDVFLFMAFLITLAIYISAKVMKSCYRCFCNKRKIKPD